MFEGTSVQFVVDAEEVRQELKAAQLNWPIVKILGQEEDEEKDPEDMSVSGEGVAIYIDSIEVDRTVLCVDIPNTFSPNNDLYNDTWNVNLDPYGGASYVQIFSKWGQVVFSLNEINEFSWDGKFKNKPLPAGTYYYIMELNDIEYGKQTGPITIIR